MASSRLKSLQAENARLRNAIVQLSERQEVLEEFIDLNLAAELKIFLKNRDRMMFALGYTLEDILLQFGKRSPKSVEFVRLMRVVKRFQRPASEKKQKRRREVVYPPELKHLKIYVNTNTGVIHRDSPNKCRKCHDPNHGYKKCPYRGDANPNLTPEVQKMIQERVDKLKELELYDPFITNRYKKRNFKDVMKPGKKCHLRRPLEVREAIKKAAQLTQPKVKTQDTT